jgi:hypothetical protein
MRVLVLGLPRTNTTSLTSALRTLGYNPYTMRHLATNPSHIQAWHSAVSSPALPAPIASILSSHDAIADLPGCMFAPALIAAYSDHAPLRGLAEEHAGQYLGALDVALVPGVSDRGTY